MSHSLKILKTFIASENFDVESVLAMLKLDKVVEELGKEGLISEILINNDLLKNKEVVDYLRKFVDARIKDEEQRSIDVLRAKISERDYHRYDEIISHKSDAITGMDIKADREFPLRYYAFYPKQSKGVFFAEISVYAPSGARSHEYRTIQFISEPLSQYFPDAGCSFKTKDGKPMIIDYAFVVRCIDPNNAIPQITNARAMQALCTSLGFDQIDIRDTAHISYIELPSGETAIKFDNYPTMKSLADAFNSKFEESQARSIIASRDANIDVTTIGDYIGICYMKERDVILVPESFRVFAHHTTDTFSSRIFEFTTEPSKALDELKAAVSKASNFATLTTVGTKTKVTINPLNENPRRIQNTKITISYRDKLTHPAEVFCKDVAARLKAVGIEGRFNVLPSRSDREVPTFDANFMRASVHQGVDISGIEDRNAEFERAFGVILREMVMEKLLIVKRSNDSREEYAAVGVNSTGPITSPGFTVTFIHMGMDELANNVDTRMYVRMTNAVRGALLPIFIKNPSFVSVGLNKNLVDVIGGRITKGSWMQGRETRYKYTPTNFSFFDEWQTNATDSESAIGISSSMNRFARCIFDFSEIKPHRVLSLSSERTKSCNVVMYLVSFNKSSPPVLSADSDPPLCDPIFVEDGKRLYIMARRKPTLKFESNLYLKQYLTSQITTEAASSAKELVTVEFDSTNVPIFSPGTITRFMIETLNSDINSQRLIKALVNAFNANNQRIVYLDTFCVICSSAHNFLIAEEFSTEEINVISRFFSRIHTESRIVGAGERAITASTFELTPELRWISPFFKLMIQSVSHRIGSHDILQMTPMVFADIADEKNSFEVAISTELRTPAVNPKNLSTVASLVLGEISSGLEGITEEDIDHSPFMSSIAKNFEIFSNLVNEGELIDADLVEKISHLNPYVLSIIISNLRRYINSSFIFEDIVSVFSQMSINPNSYETFDIEGKICILLDENIIDMIVTLGEVFLPKSGVSVTFKRTDSFKSSIDRTKRGDDMFDAFFTMKIPASNDESDDDDLILSYASTHLRYERVNEFQAPEISDISIESTVSDGDVRTIKFFLPFSSNGGNLVVSRTTIEENDIVVSLITKACYVVVCDNVDIPDEKIIHGLFDESTLNMSDIDSSILTLLSGSTAIKSFQFFPDFSAKTYLIHRFLINDSMVFDIDVSGSRYLMPRNSYDVYAQMISSKVGDKFTMLELNRAKADTILASRQEDWWSIANRIKNVEFTPHSVISLYQSQSTQFDHDKLVIISKDSIATKNYGVTAYNSSMSLPFSPDRAVVSDFQAVPDFASLVNDPAFVGMSQSDIEAYFSNSRLPIDLYDSAIDKEASEIDKAIRGELQVKYNINFALENLSHKSKTIQSVTYSSDNFIRWTKLSKDKSILAVATDNDIEIYFLSGDRFRHISSLNHEDVSNIIFGGTLAITICNRGADQSVKLWVLATGKSIDVNLPIYRFTRDDVVSGDIVIGNQVTKMSNVKLTDVKYENGLDKEPTYKVMNNVLENVVGDIDFNKFFFSDSGRYLAYNHKTEARILDLVTLSQVKITLSGGSRGPVILEMIVDGNWTNRDGKEVFIGVGRSTPKKILFVTPADASVSVISLANPLPSIVSSTSLTVDYDHSDPLVTAVSNKAGLYSNLFGFWLFDMFIELVFGDEVLNVVFHQNGLYTTRKFKLIKDETQEDNVYSAGEDGFSITNLVDFKNSFIDQVAIAFKDEVSIAKLGIRGKSILGKNWVNSEVELPVLINNGKSIYIVSMDAINYAAVGYAKVDDRTQTFITRFSPAGRVDYVLDTSASLVTIDGELHLLSVINGDKMLSPLKTSDKIFGTNTSAAIKDLYEITTDSQGDRISNQVVVYNRISKVSYSTTTGMDKSLDEYPISSKLNLNRFERFQIKELDALKVDHAKRKGNLALFIEGDTLKVLPAKVQFPDGYIKSDDIIPLDIQNRFTTTTLNDFKSRCEKLKIVVNALIETYPELAENNVTRTSIYRIILGNGDKMPGSTHDDLKTFIRGKISDTPNPNKIIRDDPRISVITNIKHQTIMTGFLRGFNPATITMDAYKNGRDDSVEALQSILPEIKLPTKRIFNAIQVFVNILGNFSIKGIPINDINRHRLEKLEAELKLHETESYLDARALFGIREMFVKLNGTTSFNTDYLLTFDGIKSSIFNVLVRNCRAMQSLLSNDSKYELYRDKTITALRSEIREKMISYYGLSDKFITSGGVNSKAMAAFSLKVEEPLLYRAYSNSKTIKREVKELKEILKVHFKFSDPILEGVTYNYHELKQMAKSDRINADRYSGYLEQLVSEIESILEIRRVNLSRVDEITNMADVVLRKSKEISRLEADIASKRQARDTAYSTIRSEKLNAELPPNFRDLPSQINSLDLAIRTLYDLKYSIDSIDKWKYAAIYSLYSTNVKAEMDKYHSLRKISLHMFKLASLVAAVSQITSEKDIDEKDTVTKPKGKNKSDHKLDEMEETDKYKVDDDTDFSAISEFFNEEIDGIFEYIGEFIDEELDDPIYTGDMVNEQIIANMYILQGLKTNTINIMKAMAGIDSIPRLKNEYLNLNSDVKRYSKFMEQKGMDFAQIIASACVQASGETFNDVSERIKLLTSVNFEDQSGGGAFSTNGINDDILRSIQEPNSEVLDQLETTVSYDINKSGRREITTRLKVTHSFPIPKYIFTSIGDDEHRIYRISRDSFRVIHARDVFNSFCEDCITDLNSGLITERVISYLIKKIKTILLKITDSNFVKDFSNSLMYYKNLIEQEFLFDLLKVLEDIKTRGVLPNYSSASIEKISENFTEVISFLNSVIDIALPEPLSKISRDSKAFGIEEIESLLSEPISGELRDELEWLIDYLRAGSRNGKFDLGLTVSEFETEVVRILNKCISDFILMATDTEDRNNLETLRAVVSNISTFSIIPENERQQLESLRTIDVYNHYCILKELLVEHSNIKFEYNNVPLSIYFRKSFNTDFDKYDLLEWYVENGNSKNVRNDLPDIFYNYHIGSIEKSVSYALFKISQRQCLSFSTPSEEYKEMEEILKPMMHNYRNGFSECTHTFVNQICVKFPKNIKFKIQDSREIDENELGDIELEYDNPEEQSYGLTVSHSFRVNLAELIRNASYDGIEKFSETLFNVRGYLTVDKNGVYNSPITKDTVIGGLLGRKSVTSFINEINSISEKVQRFFSDGSIALRRVEGKSVDITSDIVAERNIMANDLEAKLKTCIIGEVQIETSKRYVRKTIGVQFGENIVKMEVFTKKTYVSEIPGFISGNEDFGFSNLHLLTEPIVVKGSHGMRDLVVKGKSERTHVLRICNVKGENKKKSGLLHFRSITDGKRSMIMTHPFPANTEVEVKDSKLIFYKMVESPSKTKERVNVEELNLANIQTMSTVPELSANLFKDAKYDKPIIFNKDKYTIMITHYIAKGETTAKVTKITRQVNDRKGNRKTVTDTFFGGDVEDKSFKGSVINIVSMEDGTIKNLLNWVIPSLRVESVNFNPPFDEYRGSLTILGSSDCSKGHKIRLGTIYLTENNTKSIIINSFDSEAKIANPFYDYIGFLKSSSGLTDFCVVSGNRKGKPTSSIFIWHDIIFQREVSGEIVGLDAARSSKYAAVQFKDRTEIWNRNCEKMEEFDGEASWI